MKPFFSIIIPTYNSEKFIKKCIDSIYENHFKNLEIIVVDNNSRDKTLKIVKNSKLKKKIKVFKNNYNKERAYSRNFGFLKSKGEYIIFLDSDDILKKKFLINFKKFIDNLKKKNIYLFYSRFEKINHLRRKIQKFNKKYLYLNNLLDENNLPNIGIVLRRVVCEKIKWDENYYLTGFEDYDFYLRILIKYKIGMRFSNHTLSSINDHPFRSVYINKSIKKLKNQINYFENKVLNHKPYLELSYKKRNRIISSAIFAVCEDVINIKEYFFFISLLFRSLKLNIKLLISRRFVFLILFFLKKLIIR